MLIVEEVSLTEKNREIISIRCYRRLNCLVATVAATCLFATAVYASELVYTPQNPSFGGNIANGSYLLGLASAQRQFEQERDEDTALEQFNERLERSLLSRITSAATRDIVDIDGNIVPGEFDTTDFHIVIEDDGAGYIIITTTDKITGEQSIIRVESSL